MTDTTARLCISVCLCTYRRNTQLGLLLDDLARQTLLPQEVVVVDNDASGAARGVVEGRTAPFPLRYAIQPEKNISLTRNVSIAMASGEWLAIIDDDERAPTDWLEGMARTVITAGADGVLGHVDCIVPDTAPDWLRAGRFYDSLPNVHGKVFPINRISKGNALLRAPAVRAQAGPYDPALGLTGGEDADLYSRLVHAGARLVWCDRPRLTEPVDPARLNARWLLLRAYRGGQDYARFLRRGDYGPSSLPRSLGWFAEFTLKLFTGLTMAALTLPLGYHRSMQWLVKAAANWGKITSYWGWHHSEYAAPDTKVQARP